MSDIHTHKVVTQFVNNRYAVTDIKSSKYFREKMPTVIAHFVKAYKDGIPYLFLVVEDTACDCPLYIEKIIF